MWKHTGAVGAHLHPGAEFAQFRRLLVNIHVDAAADQCQRSGQPPMPPPTMAILSGIHAFTFGLCRLARSVAIEIDENVVIF